MTSNDQRPRPGGSDRGRLPGPHVQLSLPLPPNDGDGHRPPRLFGTGSLGHILGRFVVGGRRVRLHVATRDVTEAMACLTAAYVTARWLHDAGRHELFRRFVCEMGWDRLEAFMPGKPRLHS